MDLEDSFCRPPLPEDDCAYNDDEAGEDCHDETLQLPGFFSLILLFITLIGISAQQEESTF